MTQLDMGKDLRDAALEKSKQGREERIDAIRTFLRQLRWMEGGCYPELTADDVWGAAESLGLLDADNRWLGSVLRGWPLVENTGRYTPSERAVNHARPIPVFRWV